MNLLHITTEELKENSALTRNTLRETNEQTTGTVNTVEERE